MQTEYLEKEKEMVKSHEILLKQKMEEFESNASVNGEELKLSEDNLKKAMEEIATLKENLAKVSNENDSLIKASESEETKGNAELETLRKAFEEQTARLNTLKENKTKLGEKAKQILKKLNQTKEALATAEAANGKLKEEISSLRDESNKNSEMVEAGKDLEGKTKEVESQLAEALSTISALTAKVTQSDQKLVEMMNTSNSESSDIRANLNSALKEKDSLVKSLEENERQLSETQERLERKQEMLKKLADRYKKLQKAFADAKSKLESSTEQENEVLNALQEKLESMESKWSARDKELVDKDDECIRLKQEIADMLASHETKNRNESAFEGKYNALKEAHDRLNSDFDQYKVKAGAALKAQEESDLHRVEEYKAKAEKLAESVKKTEAQLAECKTKLKDLLSVLKQTKAKVTAGDKKIEQLQQALSEETEQVIAIKETHVLEKETAQQQFREEHESLQSRIDMLEDQVEKHQAENEQLLQNDAQMSESRHLEESAPDAPKGENASPLTTPNDWRSSMGLGMDASMAANLIEEALKGYEAPANDAGDPRQTPTYSLEELPQSEGFGVFSSLSSMAVDVTNEPALHGNMTTAQISGLETGDSAKREKEENDETGRQENVLAAVVNKVVEETSSYDIMEKTDDNFHLRPRKPLREQLRHTQRELDILKDDYTDIKEMNELHLSQQKVLKDEIREMRRQISRDKSLAKDENSTINLEYLKNCVYKYMATDEPEERLTLVDPIATILKLSPQEADTVKRVASYEANATVISSFTNFFSPYTPTKQ
jgi:chromosome segregation ATPase